MLLTTDLLPVSIVSILNSYRWFEVISQNYRISYSETNIIKTINEHFDFSTLNPFEFIFGIGRDMGGDPGYTE
jgi:hypothetical protein